MPWRFAVKNKYLKHAELKPVGHIAITPIVVTSILHTRNWSVTGSLWTTLTQWFSSIMQSLLSSIACLILIRMKVSWLSILSHWLFVFTLTYFRFSNYATPLTSLQPCDLLQRFLIASEWLLLSQRYSVRLLRIRNLHLQFFHQFSVLQRPWVQYSTHTGSDAGPSVTNRTNFVYAMFLYYFII